MKTTVLLITISLFPNILSAQQERQDATSVILLRDSLFWTAYDNCNVDEMKHFFTNDVEFYHDRNGITSGLDNLIIDLNKNLCGNANFKLRREPVEGTIKVFLLKSTDAIYGALIAGEHLFYLLEKGKREKLDGYGKFANVWVLRDNVWKMSRILSYEHGPAPYVNKRKAITLSDDILDQLAGQYVAPKSGKCKVQRETDLLHLLIGDQKYILYAQSENIFFVKDRDLTFEFIRNQNGDVSKMSVRENGDIVEEAIKQN